MPKAVSLMSVNQQRVLNVVSLNRSSHKPRLRIDWLAAMPAGGSKEPSVSPGVMAVFADSESLHSKRPHIPGTHAGPVRCAHLQPLSRLSLRVANCPSKGPAGLASWTVDVDGVSVAWSGVRGAYAQAHPSTVLSLRLKQVPQGSRRTGGWESPLSAVMPTAASPDTSVLATPEAPPVSTCPLASRRQLPLSGTVHPPHSLPREFGR